jgi:hypothetical protein
MREPAAAFLSLVLSEEYNVMIKSRKQNSTTYPQAFFMADSSDHVTGKVGLSPTVTLSKNSGSFAAASGAVSEIGNGWYSLAGNATDRNTLGEQLLHAEASGADDFDGQYSIVDFEPFVFKPPVTLAAEDVSGNVPSDAYAVAVDLRKRGFNKLAVTDATGAYTLYDDNSTDALYTGTVTDNLTTTIRTKMA